MLITKIYKRSIQRQNRQTGLTQSHAGETPLPAARSILRNTNPVLLHMLFFAGLVAFGGATRPDPIPNSAVKRSSANGTMSQDLGE